MSGDVELNPGPLDGWWIENYLLVLTLTALKCIYGFSDQIEIEQILATVNDTTFGRWLVFFSQFNTQ